MPMSDVRIEQTSTTSEEVSSECPLCAAGVSFSSSARSGEIVACKTCGAELEVLTVDPPQLAVAPEIEEDWGE
jgi:alpha-aminoadipate/glutamate carrier protein LysW